MFKSFESFPFTDFSVEFGNFTFEMADNIFNKVFKEDKEMYIIFHLG